MQFNVLMRAALSLTLAGVLVACGGGGEGGSADPGSAPAVGGPTGLVPAAPTPGAQLHARAADIRPLAAGSRWFYRTADYASGSFGQETVKQTAGPVPGSVREFSSLEPTDVSTVSLDASGNVQFSGQLVLVSGRPGIAISGLELKSPVRANEQVVVFDQRIADSGIDVDGDGRQDTLDLAIWRRVVGNEELAVPDISGTITAVRVDTFLAARVTPSAGGAPQTLNSQVSTWYAPGLGPVRSATPGTAGRAHDNDDRLLGYDGVTSGWGWLTDDQPSWELGSVANRPLFALTLPDGALVDGGQRLFKTDRNGRVLASADFTPGGVVPVKRGMVRFGAGARIFTGTFPGFEIHPVDEATAAASPSTRSIDLSGRAGAFPVDLDVSFMADPGAPVMWAVWRRLFTAGPGVQANEIVLRRIDDSGVVGDEVRIALDSTTVDVRARPRADGLVITWVDYEPTGEYANRIVIVSNGGVQGTQQAWVTPRPSGATSWPSLEILANGSASWLVWNGPSAGTQALSPHGLRIDAAGVPIGSLTDNASLLSASLDALTDTAADGNWWSRMATSGNRWFSASRDFGLVYADDPLPRFWLDYRELDVGAGALGGNLQTRMRLRLSAEQPLSMLPIVFPDRVLLMTDNGLSVKPTVVWRR